MKFNHTAHKELWNWLADNPGKKKFEWPGWERNGGSYKKIESSCFACEYDTNTHGPACENCPLIWERDYCRDSLSCYTLWRNAVASQDYIECTKLALQLANLQIREGVECE